MYEFVNDASHKALLTLQILYLFFPNIHSTINTIMACVSFPLTTDHFLIHMSVSKSRHFSRPMDRNAAGESREMLLLFYAIALDLPEPTVDSPLQNKELRINQ